MLLLVVGLLPASALKNRLLRLLGHRVHRTARIGPSLFVGVRRLELGPGAQIGALNGFRRLTLLRLDDDALIGTLNWISAAPFLVEHGDRETAGRMVLERHAGITQRHYLDASGGITLRAYSLLAGVRSVVLTHEVDHRANLLVTAPVTVGDHALVSSSTKVVMGALVPERSLVAMGATVVRGLTEPGRLYAGVPARDKGPVDGAYFRRTVGEVPAGPTPAPSPER